MKKKPFLLRRIMEWGVLERRVAGVNIYTDYLKLIKINCGLYLASYFRVS